MKLKFLEYIYNNPALVIFLLCFILMGLFKSHNRIPQSNTRDICKNSKGENIIECGNYKHRFDNVPKYFLNTDEGYNPKSEYLERKN